MKAVRSRLALCRREMGSGSSEIKPRQKASAEVDGENPIKDLVKQESGQRGWFWMLAKLRRQSGRESRGQVW